MSISLTLPGLERGLSNFFSSSPPTRIIFAGSMNPGAYQVLLNIGGCYREKGEYDKAIENLEEFIF